MKNRRFAITILFFAMGGMFLVFEAVGQDVDESQMVGFACFYDGRETEVVRRFSKYLRQKRYNTIKLMLRSGNNADRLMAVLCLERLASVGRLVLSDEQRNLIGEIKASESRIGVCSGCFPYPDIPLHQAFETDILWRASAWLDQHVKE